MNEVVDNAGGGNRLMLENEPASTEFDREKLRFGVLDRVGVCVGDSTDKDFGMGDNGRIGTDTEVEQ